MTTSADLSINPSGDATGMAHNAVPGAIDVSHGPILYVEGVSVSFDGFKALNDLSFTLDAGELRCVIGPNGAGKTTMMDVITGKTRPDSGRLFLGQTIDLTQLTEYEIARRGIGRKFQKPTVFESHTVSENLELAMKADKGVWATLFNRASAARVTGTGCQRIGLPSADSLAGLLSHGQEAAAGNRHVADAGPADPLLMSRSPA
jgi:urea transport system ATP-binding protein